VSFAIASAAVLLMIFFVGLRLQLHPAESPISATVALIAPLGVVGSLMLNELLYLAFGWQIAAASPEAVKALARPDDSRTAHSGAAVRDRVGGHRHRKQTVDRVSRVARHHRIHCRTGAGLRRPAHRPATSHQRCSNKSSPSCSWYEF
jgi:hypothetical protein